MEEWMEKYLGKPKPKKKRESEWPFWLGYLGAIGIFAIIKGCL